MGQEDVNGAEFEKGASAEAIGQQGEIKSGYDTASTRLVLETMIQAVNAEHRRVQTLEQKCVTLLGFALLVTVLMGHTSSQLVAEAAWTRVPLAIVIFCLGVGVVALMYGLKVKTYERPDVRNLLEPKVLTDSEANVAARLAATWERAEQSVKVPAAQIISAYNIGSVAITVAVLIVLICLIIVLTVA